MFLNNLFSYCTTSGNFKLKVKKEVQIEEISFHSVTESSGAFLFVLVAAC